VPLDEIISAWRVNNAVNLELLELCPDSTFEFKPGKGKTIRSNFVHILSVRGSHANAKSSKFVPPKLDWQTATRAEIVQGLAVTYEMIEVVLGMRAEKADRFSPELFLSYLVAHEAHHRSQIEIALRMNGAEPPDEDLYRLWEWPKKAKGF
jgi:uncharacterized damage-inducible protein DinB